jgi:PAS domain S-box-containing protein
MSQATAQVQKPSAVSSASGRSRRLLWFGIFIAVVLIGVIFAVAYQMIANTQKTMEEELQQRQATVAASRVETTDAWMESLVEQSRRLVGSDLFQLFASEVDKLPGGVPLLFAPEGPDKEAQMPSEDDTAEQLSSQLPLMRTMLTEFTAFAGFSAARIVNSKAVTYMTTDAAMPVLSSGQKRMAEQVLATGQRLYAPMELGNRGLILDIYIPIMPPAYQQVDGRPVAVLIVTQPVEAKLAEILSPGVAGERGRQLKVVQKNGDIFQHVAPSSTMLRQVTDFTVNESGALSFGLRRGIGESTDVYSSGLRLRASDIWIVVENDASIIQGTLAEQAKVTYILAAVISLALVLLISAVWWRLVGHEQKSINTEMTKLLQLVDEQKKLLDGINSTITDMISLTDGKGIYRYVNNAFAVTVGRNSTDEVIGLDGPAVFGFDTAKRLNASDQHVLMTGESVSITEVLWLQSKKYHFQISKMPLRDSVTRTPQGIVSVFRDITELVETQERSRRTVQQTIDALILAIEESDPFLGGHSRIMSGISALMTKQMRLSDRDAATVEAAANLSQIGKMFVPREILLKPGALTPEEKQQMEFHVEYAYNVLKDIEFELPVVDAIYQMHEHLDGGGYPKGLSGDEVSMPARVLAVANAFAAMARPRSYRPALPVADVIGILEKQSGSYDADVVAALKQVMATPAGERLVAQAAASKAV